MLSLKRKLGHLFVALIMAFALLTLPTPETDAADHLDGGGGRNSQFDAITDITDVWAFLDPNDNNRVELILGVRPFIIPGENESSAYFDQNVTYRFNIENTGDAKPDRFIDVTFSQQTNRSVPQTATVKITGDRGPSVTFTAPTTTVSGEPGIPPARNITVSSSNNIKFFAGLADDPFFFDVPAEIGFRKSLVAGRGNPDLFLRGRDTFRGYNVLTIVLSVPADLLKGSGNVIGVGGATLRPQKTTRMPDGRDVFKGKLVQIDAMGIPVINVVLVPLARKDEYNARTPDNSAFANDIVGSLRSLGTDQTSLDILGSVVIATGDYLRLDLSKQNTGPEGGNNPGAAFPNGRRLLDDVTDTIVTLINNRVEQPDDILLNDKKFLDDFPWVAEPHQPLPLKNDVDGTQN
ncbi:MAG: DUF4331 family protein [Blastocatellia bacterium]